MEIAQEVYLQLIREAKAAIPLECCGYLAGRQGKIVKAFPMENIDKSRVHYSFDPQEQFRTVKEIRKANLTVIGVYHSHPETPARPSEEDIRLAYDPEVSHVIISLAKEKEDLRSFKIRNGVVEPEELELL